MGLRTRKIRKLMAERAEACQNELNQKLGSNFQFEIDWNVVPDNVDGWNWEDAPLMDCFATNFFGPMDAAFVEMFKDEMYKEAITEQVEKIKMVPGPEGYMKWSVDDKTLLCEHTLSVNHKTIDGAASYIKDNVNVITAAIESGLS
ncbi:MAG: hypothetical protein P1V97_36820 [Planctomycetota bacterium]|nr:hypothetical protein [Planctomycetota bacterium]